MLHYRVEYGEQQTWPTSFLSQNRTYESRIRFLSILPSKFLRRCVRLDVQELVPETFE